jgi:hypothetical protein
MIRVAFLILTLLASGSAYAEKMRTTHVRSADGIEVTLQYQIVQKCTLVKEGVSHNLRFADPVQFSAKNLPDNTRVSVQIEFWGQYRGHDGQQNPIMRLSQFPDQLVSLAQADNVWVGIAGKLLVRDELVEAHDSWLIFQTLRIMIDGRPLIDPVTGTDRFQISLDDNGVCAPN